MNNTNTNKEYLTSRVVIYEIIMIIYGEVLLSIGTTYANQDIWISKLITIGFTLILGGILAIILAKYPGLTIFDALEKLLGKIIGRIFMLLFILYLLFMSSLTLIKIVSFIQTLVFPGTPILFIAVFFVVPVYFAARGGLESTGRAISIFFPIIIFFSITTQLLLIPNMEFANILPIGKEPFKNIMKSAFINLAISNGDIVVFLALPISPRPKYNPIKAFSLGTIFGGVLFTSIIVTAILVLSAPVVNRLIYPIYTMYTVIDVFEIITRIQVLVSSIHILGVFVKFGIFIVATCYGLGKVFVKEYRSFSIPCLLVVLISIQFVYKNTEQVYIFMEKYSWYKMIFQIGFPIFIIIIMLFHRLLSHKEKGPSSTQSEPISVS